MDSEIARDYAEQAARYLASIQDAFKLQIRLIAIDAPSGFCEEGKKLRDCEAALSDAGISFFSTPTRNDFESILAAARKHRDQGGDMNKVPHSNKLWMNAGFALFSVLTRSWECIETYPHAIAQAMGVRTKKNKGSGYRIHLQAAAIRTGWTSHETELRAIGFGDPHDRADAYLASWVASLPPEGRRRYGSDPTDAVWVPRAK